MGRDFASGLAEGPFTISARAARTNRSTQHWMVELQQTGAQGGAPETVLTATVLTAMRRSTWSGSDVPMPEVPGPATLPPGERMIPLEWLRHYEVLPVVGGKYSSCAFSVVAPKRPSINDRRSLMIG